MLPYAFSRDLLSNCLLFAQKSSLCRCFAFSCHLILDSLDAAIILILDLLKLQFLALDQLADLLMTLGKGLDLAITVLSGSTG